MAKITGAPPTRRRAAAGTWQWARLQCDHAPNEAHTVRAAPANGLWRTPPAGPTAQRPKLTSSPSPGTLDDNTIPPRRRHPPLSCFTPSRKKRVRGQHRQKKKKKGTGKKKTTPERLHESSRASSSTKL
jgi:hypothetical protein